MIILFIVLYGFGSAFWVLNMSRLANDQGELVNSYHRFWFVNTFQYIFLLGLGEFDLDNATEGNNVFLFYCLFNLATFMILIVFLNMLIAIMGDTFGQVTQERDKHRRMTALAIMDDYIKLIGHNSIYRRRSIKQ